MAPGAAARGGQPAPERQRKRQHQRGGAEVHAAPAGQVADAAGKYPGQQQTDEYAALRRADHAPLLMGRGGAGRVGDQALGHGRAQQAHGKHARQQGGRGARQAHRRQRGGQRQQLQAHQATAIDPVAQRHQQQQGQRATCLRGRDHAADGGVADAEVARQGVEQGLGVIDIGHAQAAGDGEQPCQAAGHARGPGRCVASRGRKWRCGSSLHDSGSIQSGFKTKLVEC